MEISEPVLQSILENVPGIVIAVDKEHKLRFINHTVSGLTKEEVIGKSQFDYIAPEHHQLVREANERVLRTGEAAYYEIAGTGPDGRTSWYSTTTQPLRIDGEIVGLVLFTTDVTETKQAEQQLEKSEARHRGVMANVPGMVYRAKADWTTEIVRGCKRLTGYSADEIEAREGAWLSVIHPDDRDAVFAEGATIRERPAALVQQYRIVCKDGQTRWVEDRRTSFFEDGQFAGVDGIVLDVTDRVMAQKQLNEAQDELIKQQQQAIHELSAPVIQVWDNILVLPLVGHVDTKRVRLLTERLLGVVTAKQADVVIIDVTGVPVLDTAVAGSLINTARAVRLLGAECALTGISPDIAQLLVTAGMSLGEIKTLGSLQAALRYAFGRRGLQVRDVAFNRASAQRVARGQPE